MAPSSAHDDSRGVGWTHLVDDRPDQVVIALQRRVQQDGQRLELDPQAAVRRDGGRRPQDGLVSLERVREDKAASP